MELINHDITGTKRVSNFIKQIKVNRKIHWLLRWSWGRKLPKGKQSSLANAMCETILNKNVQSHDVLSL